MEPVHLETQPVTGMGLKWIGWLLAGFTQPVHSRLYYKLNGQWYLTELTTTPAYPEYEEVGKGDGYTIYIYKVPVPNGITLGTEIDTTIIDKWARRYASIDRGCWTSASESDWYESPQLCGGPMYDRNTSNTYVSWLLRKASISLAAPKGAVGWNSKPRFPAPTMCGYIHE